MCCLLYEKQYYQDAMSEYPPLDSRVSSQKGEGVISKVDVFGQRVYVKYDNEEWEAYSKDELSKLTVIESSENDKSDNQR